ncbi:aspartate aminotransferase family protein [Microbacterium testaceum]|uniref:aspartate aminotransferase family protein n=1 Tax=Microbacterium testaceum TaxID=2033 RepID=UPI002AC5D47A|nr:aminotransferase class III-fold pyridoxal phosphate-dependent enzyme [Microbacterium testaceum]MDZ5146348.1 aminotransferase class III-fold pyridoxal phosphate-dependent enzyme [Microbacterium testaceum]
MSELGHRLGCGDVPAGRTSLALKRREKQEHRKEHPLTTSEMQNAVDEATAAVYYPVSDLKMTRGEGIYLFDSEGRGYIDCASATFNLSLGYSHAAVVSAIKEQAEQLIHVTSSFQTDQINDLSRRLVDLAPGNITKAHLKVGGGSEANEGAVKMAQRATGRRDAVTLFRAHVGQTMMMTSMSGNAFRREPFGTLFHNTLQVPDPYCHRCFYAQQKDSCGRLCVTRLYDFMEYASSGSVAAFLVEPISGNGGNIVPPDGYFAGLRKFCDDMGIKLILDEIQTGIGRTGRMFAAEHFDVRPDAITVAKGLGGSGAQVAAILTDDDLAGMPGDQHSFTYGSNVLAAAAALATLDVIDDEAFLANVRATGEHILARLRDMQRRHLVIDDVRGVGLMIGIEISGPDGTPNVRLTNELAARAMDFGLILRTSRYGRGNVLKIRPPLTLTMAEADLICDRFDQLLSAHAH